MQPLPLITVDDHTGALRLHPAAVDVISSIDSKLVVLSVCGPARSGKSYLLNCLGGVTAFEVGHLTASHTAGFWAWLHPTKIRLSDDSMATVLLLDSEGFGATTRDHRHDTRIFTLCVLLSSLLVYNTCGSIDEKAIQALAFVSQISVQLRNRGSDSGVDVFPDFTWVVRDFALDLVDQHSHPITANQYLERCLASSPGFDAPTQAKNHTREALRACFPRRQCFTVVRPHVHEGHSVTAAADPFHGCRPEFTKKIAELTEFVWSQAPVKELHGNALDGPAFITLCKHYVAKLNEPEGVPHPETAWQAVVEQGNRSAAAAALNAHHDALCRTVALEHHPRPLRDALTSAASEAWPECSVRDLALAHGGARREAMAVFADRSFEAKGVTETNRAQLENDLSSALRKWLDGTAAASEETCSRCCDEALHAFEVALQQSRTDSSFFQSLSGAWKQFCDVYYGRDRAAGPAKYRTVASSIPMLLRGAAGVHERVVAAAAKEAAEVAESAARNEALAARSDARYELLVRQMSLVTDSAAADANELSSLRAKVAAAAGKEERLRAELDELRGRAERASELEGRVGDLNRRVGQLEVALSASRKAEEAAVKGFKSANEANHIMAQKLMISADELAMRMHTEEDCAEQLREAQAAVTAKEEGAAALRAQVHRSESRASDLEKDLEVKGRELLFSREAAKAYAARCAIAEESCKAAEHKLGVVEEAAARNANALELAKKRTLDLETELIGLREELDSAARKSRASERAAHKAESDLSMQRTLFAHLSGQNDELERKLQAQSSNATNAALHTAQEENKKLLTELQVLRITSQAARNEAHSAASEALAAKRERVDIEHPLRQPHRSGRQVADAAVAAAAARTSAPTPPVAELPQQRCGDISALQEQLQSLVNQSRAAENDRRRAAGYYRGGRFR